MDALADSKWLPLPKSGSMGGNLGGHLGGEVWFKGESPQPAPSSAHTATHAPSPVLVAPTQPVAQAQTRFDADGQLIDDEIRDSLAAVVNDLVAAVNERQAILATA